MIIRKIIAGIMSRRDPNGGIPVDTPDRAAAENANLVTLPTNIVGKNCGNCDYMNKQGGTCKNKNLLGVRVNARMGCKFWENQTCYKTWL